jgi:hypothetical protein
MQIVPSMHPVAHMPLLQRLVTPVHWFPHFPQLNGSSYGLTHFPLQQRRSVLHAFALEGSHAPASDAPPDDDPAPELLLVPPDPLPEVLPPDPLLDALDMPPEPDVLPAPLLDPPEPLPIPLLVMPPDDPLDPPWPPLLPPLLPPLPLLDTLPELCPEELPPEPPLDPPPLVDDAVESTEASLAWTENSVPPQPAPATITAGNAKYLRLPRFMLYP